MNNEQKTGLSLRRTEYDGIHKEILAGTKEGKQVSNLEPVEQRGYKKLKDGQRDGQYSICETNLTKLLLWTQRVISRWGSPHIKGQGSTHV